MTSKSSVGYRFFLAHKPLIFEFLRYVLVGGAAFIVDFGVLLLSKTFLFSALAETGVLLAAALGFTAGLVFNYILSLVFVFRPSAEKARRHKLRSFAVFAAVGVAGLLITELCMFAGMSVFGQKYYPVIKIITAGIVLVWNYGARKILLFKGTNYEQQ
jgi:putative flippase GtrA